MRSPSASVWPSSYRLRIGDPLTLISPEGAATAFGTIPRVRAYKVVAIFDAGLNDYNSSAWCSCRWRPRRSFSRSRTR